MIALPRPRPIMLADGRLWTPQFHALLSVTPDRISLVSSTSLLGRRRCLSKPPGGICPGETALGITEMLSCPRVACTNRQGSEVIDALAPNAIFTSESRRSVGLGVRSG